MDENANITSEIHALKPNEHWRWISEWESAKLPTTYFIFLDLLLKKNKKLTITDW